MTLFGLDRLAKERVPLDPARPVAVLCRSGYRSSIATSLLERSGFTDLANVTGASAKHPVVAGGA